MTNDQPEQPAIAGIVQWVDLGAIRFGVPGVPYSVWPMAKSDDFIAEFTKAKEWADAYREVFESYKAEEPPPPATAHQTPQGQRVDQHPPSTTAPPPQQPPAPPVTAQKGVPDKGVVPGEFCDQCNQPAHYKASFTSRAKKVVGATLICTVCKSPDGKYDYNIRWLNDDDAAWATINGDVPVYEPSDLPF